MRDHRVILLFVWTPKDREVAAAAMVEASRVEEKLGALIGRFGAYFARVEPLRQAGKYIRGLLSDLPRKNCWTLAAYAGDRTPDRMQRLLERASWDMVAVMGAVRDFVVEHLADDGMTVLVLDESGDEKSGNRTAGVKRQYVGCVGKVANAVNFVNATYSTPRGHALVGSRLYVPAEQLSDAQVRAAMGIPADLPFKTKPELGLQLLAECLAAGVRAPWCCRGHPSRSRSIDFLPSSSDSHHRRRLTTAVSHPRRPTRPTDRRRLPDPPRCARSAPLPATSDFADERALVLRRRRRPARGQCSDCGAFVLVDQPVEDGA